MNKTDREYSEARETVRQAMINDERCRNSDSYLIWYVQHEMQDVDRNNVAQVLNAMDSGTIRRARRKIQNDEGVLLPTDTDVLQQRRFKEEQVREYFSSGRFADEEVIRKYTGDSE